MAIAGALALPVETTAPRGDAAIGALLFEAGAPGQNDNPVARFLAEDAPGLDWRTDFLRNPTVDRLFHDLANDGIAAADTDDEEEVVYYKSELVTTGELQNIEDTGGM